ncbi:AcrR family transcriptional regulator [Caulobacter ginsengisoli]|uniref:AcrR family transcriptional regulator n=1 Tax=Caulobacter ginsengisoli TaxID=400775 RepID=A0ABU0IN69_9CAUL|nr:TetR/AcrR family transcriptional regulator [Caulobacter ginsengisoli]MDQ0463449.1 AcrR family transcriptional regulator [Caulobacter ginsengisoli]
MSRSDRKRREILDTARILFLKEGFAGAGMETLAREAGVSTATLYAHFPSKSEMFRTVVEEAVAELARRVRDTTSHRGDPRSRLCEFAYAYAQFYADPLSRSVFRMVTAERRRFGGVADYFQDRAHSELGGAAIEILNALAAAGEIRFEKASWAAGQLLGMLEHATLVFGLVAGDDAMPRRPLKMICDDAVDTFLARYGV